MRVADFDQKQKRKKKKTMFSDYFSFRSNLEAWQENHSWLVKNIKADEEANDLIFFVCFYISIFIAACRNKN